MRSCKPVAIALLALVLSSCGVSSRMSVHQQQGEQKQQVEITTEGNVKSLSLSVVLPPIAAAR